jgi:coatomer subunit beta'
MFIFYNYTIEEKGSNNIAFACWLQLARTQECIDLLVKTDRIPEAAIFARTYMPRFVGLNWIVVW